MKELAMQRKDMGLGPVSWNVYELTTEILGKLILL